MNFLLPIQHHHCSSQGHVCIVEKKSGIVFPIRFWVELAGMRNCLWGGRLKEIRGHYCWTQSQPHKWFPTPFWNQPFPAAGWYVNICDPSWDLSRSPLPQLFRLGTHTKFPNSSHQYLVYLDSKSKNRLFSWTNPGCTAISIISLRTIVPCILPLKPL